MLGKLHPYEACAGVSHYSQAIPYNHYLYSTNIVLGDTPKYMKGVVYLTSGSSLHTGILRLWNLGALEPTSAAKDKCVSLALPVI